MYVNMTQVHNTIIYFSKSIFSSFFLLHFFALLFLSITLSLNTLFAFLQSSFLRYQLCHLCLVRLEFQHVPECGLTTAPQREKKCFWQTGYTSLSNSSNGAYGNCYLSDRMPRHAPCHMRLAAHHPCSRFCQTKKKKRKEISFSDATVVKMKGSDISLA